MSERDVGGAAPHTPRWEARTEGPMASQTHHWNFNEQYRGYYPRCDFTAEARANGVHYLAGIDDNGTPHLFTSTFTNIWDEQNLVQRDPLRGVARPTAPIIRVLPDESRHQIYLVCANGQLVTLPDCPACVRVRQVVDTAAVGAVADAALEPGVLVLRLANGVVRRLPLDEAAQYRVSIAHARTLLAEPGAALADLRADPLPPWEGAVPVPPSSLRPWLAARDRSPPVLFICRTGLLADAAVLTARRLGFPRAWSLGGAQPWAHVD